MKNFLLIFLMLSSLLSLSQEYIGIHIGIASTYLTNAGNNNGTEPIIGITSEHKISNKVNLITGVVSERKSSILITEDLGMTTRNENIEKRSISHDFLTIPMLFKINPKKKKALYFISGPFLAFKKKFESDNIGGSIFDFGLSAGTGLRIPFHKSKALNIQLKYARGLTKVAWIKHNNTEEAPQFTNSIGLTVTLEHITSKK